MKSGNPQPKCPRPRKEAPDDEPKGLLFAAVYFSRAMREICRHWGAELGSAAALAVIQLHQRQKRQQDNGAGGTLL